jgi:DNA-binding transcriptional LysR family regulator
MHLTFRQLQVFESVARRQSFTRAAQELHLSQPAVSMQIKQLENAVGLPLFEQLGKQIQLTEAGSVMLQFSRRVDGDLREAGEAIEELKGVEGGRLRIAVATTVNYFAARLLSRFCNRYPGVRVSLDVTNRQALLRQLEENSVDVVLMGRPPDGLDVEAEAFMDNPLVVVAPPTHPLCRRRRVPLSALARETFLIREPGSGTRSAMERFFADKNIAPRISVEMTSNEAIKQSVEAGLGLGLVSNHTVELECDAGRLKVLDVQSFPIKRKWYVVHRRGKRLSAAANAFREFVLNEAGRTIGNSRSRRAKVKD